MRTEKEYGKAADNGDITRPKKVCAGDVCVNGGVYAPKDKKQSFLRQQNVACPECAECVGMQIVEEKAEDCNNEALAERAKRDSVE